jgi:hypothetical protein
VGCKNSGRQKGQGKKLKEMKKKIMVMKIKKGDTPYW